MSRILTRRLALQQARNNNLKVITGDSYTILLDLDEPEDERFYSEQLPVIQAHLAIREVKRWASRNGGLHVKLRTKRKLSVRSRLLIQACLGSDRVKEFLSLVRVWKREKDPVMLFKPSRKEPPKQFEPKPSGNEFEFDDDVPF